MSKKRIILVGGGGHCKSCIEVIESVGCYQIDGILDVQDKLHQKVLNYSIIGTDENIPGAIPQQIAKDVTPNRWLYTIYLPNQLEVRKHLLANKIEVRSFWVPMNQLPAFKNDIYIHLNDVSGRVYGNCLSLPCSTNLSLDEQERVIQILQQYYLG